MTVAATSKQAYFEINVEGITQAQERNIYRIIFLSPDPMTRKEVSVEAGIDASTVGGRAFSLVENKYLIECPKRACKVTGRMAGTLRTKGRK